MQRIVLISFALLLLLIPNQGFGEDGEEADGQLAVTIQTDIQDAVRLAGASIDVIANAGQITLSGTANSIFDKEMATRIAKRTRGVKAVLNQVVILRGKRSDEEIRAAVVKRLRINQATDRPQFTVAVSGGVVSMLGQVDSLAEKRIAEMAASGVSGVTALKSQITVALTGERNERDLREEIRTLFVHSVYLDDVEMDVEIQGSTAKLKGTVQSLAQLEHAERLASVMGVSSVDVSGVEIDPKSGDPSLRKTRYAAVTDETVKQALQRSLNADPIVFDVQPDINIVVDDGTVTLTGRVDSMREKRKAEELAMGVVGAVRVVNELRVKRPENAPSDMDIIREMQETLALSPYLERHGLRVHCQRAHISLYGIVDSALKKEMAGWLAQDVTGVVHVNNSLAVEPKWEVKPDEKIEADLQRKLKYTLLADAEDIDVTVKNGVAILRGEVDTWRQWQAAMDLALEAGARHPHNLINVRYHSPHGASRIYVPY